MSLTLLGGHTEDVHAKGAAVMWIIAGHIKVDAAARDAWVAAHQDLIRRARQAPGCLDVAITPDPFDPERIYNFERWESWDAVEAWRKVAAASDTGVRFTSVEVMAYEIASERPPF
jgi:quinol monooxygenase YgiN